MKALLIAGGIIIMASLSFAAQGQQQQTGRAVFAGGCFWCMEHPFDVIEGVLSTTPGYIGGHVPNPTYKQVSSGSTGHTEAVLVEYDPERVGYEELLEVFWQNVDPLDAEGQFCDRGSQYRPGIFYGSDEQREAAQRSRSELDASGRLSGKVVVEITEAGPFYPAEEYHHDYYKRNPIRYKFYRYGCGRDKRLNELWGSGQ